MLTAALLTVAACSWDSPGADRFTGRHDAAIQAYADIPQATRDRLVEMSSRHAFTDRVTITRGKIEGQESYANLRSMYFGDNKRCGSVTRAGWSDTASVGALVYCADGYCVAVPSICGNISRVDVVPKPAAVVLVAPAVHEEVLGPVALLPIEERVVMLVPAPLPGTFEQGAGPYTPVFVQVFIPLPFGAPCPPPCAACVPLTPAVPEPGTYALMLAGLGLLWAVRKRLPKALR